MLSDGIADFYEQKFRDFKVMHRHLTGCRLTSRPRQSSTQPLRIVAYILPTVLTLGLSLGLVASQPPANGQQPDPGAAPAASIDNPPPSNPRPLLRIGSQGDDVKDLQALLTLLGFYTGEVDGFYQTSTAAAVTAFQTAAGLQTDGVVGPATWTRLLPAAQTAAPSPSPTPSTVSAVSAPETATSSSTAPAAPSPTSTPQAARPDGGATAAPSSNPSSATESPAAASPTLVDFPVLHLGMRGPAVTRLQQRLQAIGFLDGAADGVFGPTTQAAVKAAQRHFRLSPDGVVGSATWTALMQ